MNDPSASLFDHLPERLFRPLAAREHTRRNWEMICHLYDDFFAPEAAPPEGDGWTQKRVIASIERFLVRWYEVHGAEDNEVDTSLNIQSSEALNSLIDAGWFALERSGFTRFVIMRPTVQNLFELLKTFADQGPEFIGGRVQSIRNDLLQVRADPEICASVFQHAAKQCSALLRMLNTTRMRVREASEVLRQQDDPGLFMDRFFGEYISGLYIGDYQDLFSSNHPLTARWQIIRLVQEITEAPASQKALVAWYRKNLRCRDDEEAEELLEADANRVLALRNVESLLERLKQAVTRANDQALGYLEYRVRASGDFDSKIDKVIAAVVRADDSCEEGELELPMGLSAGRLLSEETLRLPTVRRRPREGAVIEKRKLSPEAQARRLVRQIMKGNREVSEKRILAYIDRHLPPEGVVESASMTVDSINDLCVLAAFSRLGMIAERAARNAKAGIQRPVLHHELERNIVIELTGERFENDYLEAPAVRVRRIRPKGAQTDAD